ncbi:MAG: hypothetical protein IT355_19210 [Gemmatimonadaceae bacterium]|nr:hypothetical protein [Gemmatimonadaceae bacterium]
MMTKHAMTLVAWATLAAAPTIMQAQADTTKLPTLAPGTCDCPEGDSRGELRNLAAFAPLGLLGALAAAGGAPALLARTDAPVDTRTFATNDPPVTETPKATEEAARNAAPSNARVDFPVPVSPDSMRGGLRAPNTGTPLPSVLLLGSGLMAVGCVTIFRNRG